MTLNRQKETELTFTVQIPVQIHCTLHLDKDAKEILNNIFKNPKKSKYEAALTVLPNTSISKATGEYRTERATIWLKEFFVDFNKKYGRYPTMDEIQFWFQEKLHVEADPTMRLFQGKDVTYNTMVKWLKAGGLKDRMTRKSKSLGDLHFDKLETERRDADEQCRAFWAQYAQRFSKENEKQDNLLTFEQCAEEWNRLLVPPKKRGRPKGYHHTEETKQKMRDSWTKERKEKQSLVGYSVARKRINKKDVERAKLTLRYL